MTDPAQLLRELHFALAEADAERVPDALRARVVGDALADRAPGVPARPPEHLTGAATFAGAVEQMDALLETLAPAEWGRRAIRDLDVQGLVGHLVGVEDAFADGLLGTAEAAVAGPADHIASTQPVAEAQRGRPPEATLADWRRATGRTLDALAGRDAALPGPDFYGIRLALEDLLVVRAFELWVHHEDVRRATGRPLAAPADAVLARMTALAVTLLPAGVALVGAARPDAAVRLVLTGPGGGTWRVPLDGAAPGRPAPDGPGEAARVVVDAADFCRVVGNRAGLASLEAEVRGDEALVGALFTGAAALALD